MNRDSRGDSKKIIVSFFVALFGFALLAGCSLPKDPRVSFGKKCSEGTDGEIAYSYVWIYSKDAGLGANKKTCKKIASDNVVKSDKVKSKN